jgi:hypothetical protein
MNYQKKVKNLYLKESTTIFGVCGSNNHCLHFLLQVKHVMKIVVGS